MGALAGATSLPPNMLVQCEGCIGQEKLDEMAKRKTPGDQKTWKLPVHFVRWRGTYTTRKETLLRGVWVRGMAQSYVHWSNKGSSWAWI